MTFSDRTWCIVLFLAGLVLFTPGFWWGLPVASGPDLLQPWGPDELAPLGPLSQPYLYFLGGGAHFNPQYTLLHYLVQAAFMAPYLAFLWLFGGVSQITVFYPYGLTDPVHSLAVLTLLARLPSLLMAAALPGIALLTARTLWDRTAGMTCGVRRL